MLFHKKKMANVPPLDKIRRMSASGISDRDIIKQLKTEGYSLSEIEKGMLEAVKQGVGSEESFPEPRPMEFAPQKQDNYMFEGTQQEPLFENYPQEQYLQQTEQEMLDTEMQSEELSPELAIEELVEGVVDEKWQKFESKMKAMENEIHDLLVSLKQVQQTPKGEIVPMDEGKFSEIHDQMEDMEVRVGGLEKAFKQFLPSLTKNIEQLSEIIKEMKEKHDED